MNLKITFLINFRNLLFFFLQNTKGILISITGQIYNVIYFILILIYYPEVLVQLVKMPKLLGRMP